MLRRRTKATLPVILLLCLLPTAFCFLLSAFISCPAGGLRRSASRVSLRRRARPVRVVAETGSARFDARRGRARARRRWSRYLGTDAGRLRPRTLGRPSAARRRRA